jgi:hypothetical protein
MWTAGYRPFYRVHSSTTRERRGSHVEGAPRRWSRRAGVLRAAHEAGAGTPARASSYFFFFFLPTVSLTFEAFGSTVPAFFGLVAITVPTCFGFFVVV